MSHVATSVLVDGYNAALGRFESAGPGTDEGFHAMLETLAWVGAVRDRLKEEGKPRPAVLEGLYYVRNLVLHQGADVLDWVSTYGRGTYGAGTYGGGSSWPPRADLPQPKSKAGLSQYDAHVAGRATTSVLQELARELAVAH